MIKLLDRESGKIVTETVLGGGTIRFAYNTLLGRTLWPILFGGKFGRVRRDLAYGAGITDKESRETKEFLENIGLLSR